MGHGIYDNVGSNWGRTKGEKLKMDWIKKHDAYLETIQNMCGPYKPVDIPKIKMNLRELVKYAKSNDKKVPELSDEEINHYILGATMDDVRNVRIIIPGVEYAN